MEQGKIIEQDSVCYLQSNIKKLVSFGEVMETIQNYQISKSLLLILKYFCVNFSSCNKNLCLILREISNFQVSLKAFRQLKIKFKILIDRRTNLRGGTAVQGKEKTYVIEQGKTIITYIITVITTDNIKQPVIHPPTHTRKSPENLKNKPPKK
eukprot:TRINITY_DN5108_c0_g2_i3.p3 TRINITY_DN5108_c0_g2~~TRINITY_DN5108_c0_g2_i3.p3  ORF type:complete len:153 (-),score=9.23 TRINITY_DN5108_c0_g2_i3:186-644(-)